MKIKPMLVLLALISIGCSCFFFGNFHVILKGFTAIITVILTILLVSVIFNEEVIKDKSEHEK